MVFALVSVIGFLAYAAKGIGKFAGEFLPGHLSDDTYAWILMGITTFYVVKGGMFSVVFTEVVQFCILTVASIAIGIIAMVKVAPDLLDRVVPAGWHDLFFGWHLNLDWTSIPEINNRIASDGYSLFGIFFMMMLFKGILISAAGPAPNYDMQRVLATKGPREAALMSSTVNVVLFFPRYMMITGLTILALAFYSTDLAAMGKDLDLEKILPLALARFVPVGILGLLMAGLIAAFMSNFAATVNAAPAYLVNDIYKRYINPNASQKRYVWLSYLASFGVVVVGLTFGLFTQSINSIVQWIVSGLWGGYTASNVLKWYWWRFNGWGYFWGMLTGIASSLGLPLVMPHIIPLFQPFVESHFGTEAAHVMVLLGHPITSFPLILGPLAGGLFPGNVPDAGRRGGGAQGFLSPGAALGFLGTDPCEGCQRRPRLSAEHGFLPRHVQYRDRHHLADVFHRAGHVPGHAPFPQYAVIALVVLVITSIILKFNWYDRLPPPTPDPVAEPPDQPGTAKPAAG